MPEEEIWYLINSITNGSRALNRMQLPHSDIKPKTIHLTKNGRVSMYNQRFLSNDRSGYQKMIVNPKYKTPISPQLLDNLRNKKVNPNCSQELSDIWAMGVTSLCACVNEDFNKYYDWPNYRVRYDLVKEDLSRMRRIGYSQDLVEFLDRCIEQTEDRRYNMKDVDRYLARIQEERSVRSGLSANSSLRNSHYAKEEESRRTKTQDQDFDKINPTSHFSAEENHARVPKRSRSSRQSPHRSGHITPRDQPPLQSHHTAPQQHRQLELIPHTHAPQDVSQTHHHYHHHHQPQPQPKQQQPINENQNPNLQIETQTTLILQPVTGKMPYYSNQQPHARQPINEHQQPVLVQQHSSSDPNDQVQFSVNRSPSSAHHNQLPSHPNSQQPSESFEYGQDQPNYGYEHPQPVQHYHPIKVDYQPRTSTYYRANPQYRSYRTSAKVTNNYPENSAIGGEVLNSVPKMKREVYERDPVQVEVQDLQMPNGEMVRRNIYTTVGRTIVEERY